MTSEACNAASEAPTVTPEGPSAALLAYQVTSRAPSVTLGPVDVAVGSTGVTFVACRITSEGLDAALEAPTVTR